MRKTVIGLGILLTCSLQADNRQEVFAALYASESGSQAPHEYEDIAHLEGRQLLKALHGKTAEHYKTYDYRPAKRKLYDEFYNFGGKVKTIYSGLSFGKEGYRYVEKGDQDQDGYADDFVNCEHIWPQSKFHKKLPMVSDLHHLYPSLSVPNRKRAHYAFGEVDEADYSTVSGSKQGHDLFEPADEDKGNVARAMFYFYTRYHDRPIWRKTDRHSFWDSRIPQFLEWNRMDPVDGAEKARNEGISTYQGNRNPFIDYPKFADQIGLRGFTHSSSLNEY